VISIVGPHLKLIGCGSEVSIVKATPESWRGDLTGSFTTESNSLLNLREVFEGRMAAV